MKFYAGIGSRETPLHVMEFMTRISTKLCQLNYSLRSGGAIGADSAFETGVFDASRKEIFKANDATDEAMLIAEQYHPKWDACSSYAKKLHARNVLIILGKNLDSPVQFVLCWTKDGKATGGTGQAIRIAEGYNIPVFNLYHDDVKTRMNIMLGECNPQLPWI